MIPHASERYPAWRAARREAGRLLLALDFDGTLAPIVERPEDAALLPAARAPLEDVLRRDDTIVAVVSGRGLKDVRARLGLDGIYYAGNHGMEIEGPDVHRLQADAAAARPRIARCLDALREALAGVDGAFVEDKELTLSIHYRRVRGEAAQREVRETVFRLCGDDPELRLTEGKCIVEVRPDVEWHKGSALAFLLDTFEAAGGRVPSLFVGDDVTDEDGFRALRGRGEGVLVAAEPPADTAASAYLRAPAEVAELLAALAAAP